MTVPIVPSQTETLVTGEELLVSGRSDLCELVEGRIVPTSPAGLRHGDYESNFDVALTAFVKSRRLGKVLVGEVGLYTHRNPDTVRAADVAFISHVPVASLFEA